MNTEEFMKSRILFTINFCPQCHIWTEVIERFNMKVPIERRIKVINCTKYHEFSIIDNPLISVYAKYINNTYPVLFFEGERVDGANTREEVEAWLYGRLYNDFVIEENPMTSFGEPFLFLKEKCEFKKTLFGRKPLCN